MSIRDHSTFCSLLQFVSSMVYIFPCSSLSHPLLSVFLGIWCFEDIINGIVFLHSFSVFYCWCIERLWIFENVLCILLLCWSCLCFLSFVWRSFWVSPKTANGDNLTSSFPIYIPFISSCLIALARNSNRILSKSGISGPPMSHSWF
jgi:hypothetical protein